MSENRVQRRIFRPRRGEEGRSCRRLHSGELQNLYDSPDIIRMIKSRRTRWTGECSTRGKCENAYKIFVGNLKGGDHSEDVGVDGKIILKCILGKWVGNCGLVDSDSG
jgi:hypothetical protein